MAATIKVPTVFTAVDNFSTPLKNMVKGVNNFSNKSVAAVTRIDHKITRSFNNLSRFSQLGLGIGLAGLFNMAVQGNIQYNESLASLSAITGSTGKDLAILENNVLSLGKKTGKSGAEVAKAFELVGSAKPELLKNVDALRQTTDAVITLSKASKLDLETSALSLTGVMNQFGLGAQYSNRTINALAAGAKEGAAAIPLVSEAILQFGTGAAASNVSLEESIALVETFAEKGIKGAESGTKLRNILTKMSATGALPKEAVTQLEKFGVNTKLVSDTTLPLNIRLQELSKIAGDSTALVKIFGLENLQAGQILLNNISTFERLTGAITGTNEAEKQASINSGTLAEMINRVKNSFTNATTATNSNSQSLENVKSILGFISENMESVIGVTGSLLAGYVAMKGILITVNALQFLYNVGLGVTAAFSNTASIAIGKNVVALNAYKTAQWLVNAAMNANPIGLIITGVAALIGLVTIIVKKYDSWGASLALLLGPFGMIINLIMSFKRHWDSIVKAFKTDGIMGGIKRIGAVILDSLLMPMQQFLKMVSKIPGVGKLVAPAMAIVDGLRAKLDLNIPESKTDPEIKNRNDNNNGLSFMPSTEQFTTQFMMQKAYAGNINLNINDKGQNIKNVDTDGDYNIIPINLSSTQGQR